MKDEVVEISYARFLTFLIKRKLWIMIPTCIVSIITVSSVFFLPNVYKADMLVIPNNTSNVGLSGGLNSQLGGLASLAGLSLGGSNNNEVTIALELLKSRSFVAHFIEKYNLEALLFASKGWDSKLQKVLYDENLFDYKEQVKVNLDEWPSNQEKYKLFLEDNLEFFFNKDAGTYTVAIKHFSPLVAKKVLEDFVNELNEVMRVRAIKDSELQLAYLSNTIQKEERSEMIKVLYQLSSEHTKRKVLAEVRREYIFKVLDPAVEPEKKFAPKRGLICILSIVGTLFCFTLIQLLIFIYRSENAS